ncbi:hypothetical protein HMPREF1521_1172 [Veillonella sp. AS16]|nr:hypothetical protein HMPREF1521_1172 [Veillonella sp. AS16]
MRATVKLKGGENIEIENPKLIRQHKSAYLKQADITDFESFKLY